MNKLSKKFAALSIGALLMGGIALSACQWCICDNAPSADLCTKGWDICVTAPW